MPLESIKLNQTKWEALKQFKLLKTLLLFDLKSVCETQRQRAVHILNELKKKIRTFRQMFCGLIETASLFVVAKYNDIGHFRCELTSLSISGDFRDFFWKVGHFLLATPFVDGNFICTYLTSSLFLSQFVSRNMYTHTHTHTHTHTQTCLYIYIYIYARPLHTSKVCHKVNFWVKFNRFEFSFPSPRLVVIPSLKSQSIQLFTHCCRGNSWINAFLNGISANWNANSLVQVLCVRTHTHTHTHTYI